MAHNMNISFSGTIFLAALLYLLIETNCQNVEPFSWSEKYMLNRCPRIYPRVFEGYAPTGNLTSGNFTEQPGARTIRHCVVSCCSESGCNVVLQHNETCYHIHCASNELCLPLARSNVLGNSVKMVLVSPVMEQEDDSWAEILEQANFNDRLQPDPLRDQISDQLSYGEETNFPNADQTTNQFLNKFRNPYDDDILARYNSKLAGNRYLDSNRAFNRFNDQYSDDLLMDASDYLNKDIKQCEVGSSTDCGKHEECIGVLKKSRSGICSCVSGFIRKDGGTCIPIIIHPLALNVKETLGLDQNKEVLNSEKLSNKSQLPNIGTNLGLQGGSTTDPQKVETSTQALKRLTVSAISKEVRLPDNEVTLSAYTIPDASGGEVYDYTWTLVSQPVGGETGTMTDKSAGTVKLSHLTEGLYRFKVSVTGNGSYGEGLANVTVLARNRINQIPTVIITPGSQTVKLPNTGAVLDGSTSHDDDGIIRWHWELQQGPLGYQPNLPETPTLQLSDLTSPGNYTFKLTVEDSDHATNSTTASVTVLKGTDYPPEANAGEDVILYLPHNNLTLNGSLSSDDREIVTWQWTKAASDQSKAVDMQNTRTPYLELSNLEEGMYTFVLKVTDSSGQTSQAEVHVFVKPPSNKPPLASAGPALDITLPLTWAILDGTGSTDDNKIVAYLWEQLSGPSSAVIIHNNESIANATGLTKGTYNIQLTVTDDNGNKATDNVILTVMQTENKRPVANAGGDQSLTLPLGVVLLNGSSSSDDLGITHFQWTREGGSLAAGRVLGSMKGPVLMLTDVVAGRYVFKLTVFDVQGLSGEDTVSIIVHPDPMILHLVQLTLNADAGMLTHSQVDTFEQKLQLLLGADTFLRVRELSQELHTGRVLLLFYVEKNDTLSHKSAILSGPYVVHLLRHKLQQDSGLLEVSVISVRTLVCQDNCSGHGVCDPDTRTCMCEAFWMQDYFSLFILGGDSNCDWSILYVVLSIFIVVILTVGGVACLCHRACHARPLVKQRYKLLGDKDEMPNFSRSIMASDSDTESDVLFESRSKHGRSNCEIQNGHHKSNGFTKLGRRIKT